MKTIANRAFRIPVPWSRRRPGISTLLGLVLQAGGMMTLCGQTIVVPPHLAETDGNTSVQTPSGDAGGTRNMTIVDAAHFKSLTGPAYLTQFAYRPNGTPGPSGPRTGVLRIYASTTRKAMSDLSTRFDENLGPDTTLVFDGTLTWDSSDLPAGGNTRQFDIRFPFTTPFLYDPAAGNLVLAIHIIEGHGNAYSWDAVSGDPTLRGLAGPGSEATVGQFGNPPVLQLTFEPAPVAHIRTSQVEVCWTSVPEATYRVEYRTDASASDWTVLAECVRATGTTTCILDALPTTPTRRLYRVVRTGCQP